MTVPVHQMPAEVRDALKKASQRSAEIAYLCMQCRTSWDRKMNPTWGSRGQNCDGRIIPIPSTAGRTHG